MAIRTAVLTEVEEPLTIKDQKRKAKQATLAAWADRWHQSPCTSVAYRTAFTRRSPQTESPTPRSPHSTKTTHRLAQLSFHFHCIITGHAFIEAYTQRFFPRHTPYQVSCPCGEPTHTGKHMLLHCLYNAQRRRYLTASGRPRNPNRLFTHPKRSAEVRRFLEETGACAK